MKVKRTIKVKAKRFELLAEKIAKYIGSPVSIIIHTVIIGSILSLGLFGVQWERVLLILTTALSIEAIFLSLFNQLITNKVVDKQ